MIPLYDKYPGRVELTKNQKGRDIKREERRIFIVKYYNDIVGEGRAKKVVSYTKAELLPLLVVREILNKH